MIGLGLLLMQLPSCEHPDPCEEVNCVNGIASETETGCGCDCTGTLYVGRNCSTPDPSQVQTFLDDGTIPLDLLNDGVPIDSFYGKSYEGGLIFHLTANGKGFVAASIDLNDAKWGCLGIEVDADGCDIGDGSLNTTRIVRDCLESEIAARLCIDLVLNDKTDWFLPSKDELNLMYTNLHLNGHGAFLADTYWSSSEFLELFAIGQDFSDGEQITPDKSSSKHVRAFRTF